MATSNRETGFGRSGPRSRNGCTMCKTRRVRCDEHHPICRNCERLRIDCVYVPAASRRSRAASSAASATSTAEISNGLSPSQNSNSPETSQASATGASCLPNTSSEGEHLAKRQQVVATLDSAASLGAGQYPSPTPYHHFYAPEQVFSNQSEGDAAFQFQTPSNANGNGSGSSVAGATTAMQGSMDTSLYLPNFDSFFNVPNLGSTFATFAFSDSQAFPGSGVSYNFDPVHGSALLQGSSGMHASPRNVPCNGNKSMATASSTTAKDSQAQITTATDPLTLKDDARAYLITYFKRSTRPPASLVSVDPAGWYQMQQYLLRTASSHSVVMKALLALTQLISVHESVLRSSSSSQWRMAFELQQKSCREVGEELGKKSVDEKSQNALLAAIFLLAWFEVICDEQDAHRSNFPTDLAESVIRGSARWNWASRRLLQWLNSFDAKASHMGGRQLLTPKSLEVVLQHRFERSYRTGDSGDSENETVSNDSEEDDGNGSASVFTQARKRRASSRSLTTRSFITPREIKMNVFNAILQPALEFHLVSQSYSRKIGSHDRHHRSRDTVEDEYEVVTACKTIDTELKRLWRQRPRVLDLTAKDLSGIVCEDIAERLDELFAVYIATFWAHFLYIHRVAWWSLPHSSTAKEALDAFWRMMCRSIGEPEGDEENRMLVIDRQKVIHPGLMWPIFMFGCEIEIGEKQQWSVTQLRLLGERTVTLDTEQQHSDALPPYRLGQKGAQNAIRASALLDEVVKRQNETGARVDGKYLSLELFGCHFTII